MNLQADATERLTIYRRLQMRNRFIAVLRLAVPAMGVLTLVVLIGQIYLSSLSGRFGVGRVTVDPEAVSVEDPQYSGVLDDGTTYQVRADAAKAALTSSDQIALTAAALTMNRANGVIMHVNAPEALLDATNEIVTIAGIAYVEDSTGTSGTIHDSVFDYANQKLVGQGAVHIDYADGTTLDGIGITYDVVGAVWTFSKASVTLPATPGTATSEPTTP